MLRKQFMMTRGATVTRDTKLLDSGGVCSSSSILFKSSY